jgi:hypothetical protein
VLKLAPGIRGYDAVSDRRTSTSETAMLPILFFLIAAPIPVGVDLESPGTVEVAPTSPGCGHCHETDHPTNPGELIHQMTQHLPKDVECSSAGGHPIHDCEGGDGANWAPGGCDTHRPCEPTFMVVATASGAPPCSSG